MIAWVLAKIRLWLGTKSSKDERTIRAIESFKSLRSFVLVLQKYTQELPDQDQTIKAKMKIAMFLANAHLQVLDDYFKGA